jgi:glycine cleavage system H protein
VAGVVAAVNERLADAPETINADPYGEGWLVDISVPGEGGDPIGALLDADAYQAVVDAS